MIGMKDFLAAASVVALSASTTVASVATVNLLTINAAQAATVSRIDVRGNKRVDASVIIGYVRPAVARSPTAENRLHGPCRR